MFRIFVFLFAFFVGVAIPGFTTNAQPLSFEASYTGDQLNNLRGGIKRGAFYLGKASLNISFDTEKAGLWKGGSFQIHGANTHGSMPSERTFCDLQIVSNIEAGNHTFLQEFWYKQAIGSWELTLGLQDLNVAFAHTEHAGLFLNSSFGILPIVSTNIPAPIFPLTSLGLSVQWNASNRFTLRSAVYDGVPNEFEDSPHNLDINLHSGDELLGIAEAEYRVHINHRPGTIKAGAFLHNHLLEGGSPEGQNISQFGFYLLADQIVWEQPNNQRSIGVFLHTGLAPDRDSDTRYYLGGGINYYGLFSRKGRGVAGLAVAHAGRRPEPGNETVVELSYQRYLFEKLFIQPDMQYIINPAGSGTKLDNALVAGLRFGFSF